jgi:hypothetical protein
MKRYFVNAPDGKDVTVSTQYGNQTFIHGAVLSNLGVLPSAHPGIFIEMPSTEAVAEQVTEPQLLLEKEKVEEAPKKVVPKRKPAARKPAPKKK